MKKLHSAAITFPAEPCPAMPNLMMSRWIDKLHLNIDAFVPLHQSLFR
jgi:hypothetical protein